MLSVDEYLRIKPSNIWMHAIDAVMHILKGDLNRTAYGDKHPTWDCWKDFRTEMEEHGVKKDSFQDIIKEKYRPVYKVKSFDSECGELDVDRYLDRNSRCFNEYERDMTHKPAVSLVIDASIPAMERGGTAMINRHKIIYSIAVECEAERRPCRVIAVGGIRISEVRQNMKMYLVVKDYDDPIFPGIWSAFKSNRATNNFLNCFMDFIVGTHDSGNGTAVTVDIGEDMFSDSVQLIDTKRVILNGKQGGEV